MSAWGPKMSDTNDPWMPGDRKRRAPRKHVFVMAQISGDFGVATAKILDLSELGARLNCPIDLKVGDKLTLKRGDVSVPSRVTWMRGQRVGVEFLDATPTERLMAAPSPAATAEEAQVTSEAFRVAPMPALSRAQERRLAQIWAEE